MKIRFKAIIINFLAINFIGQLMGMQQLADKDIRTAAQNMTLEESKQMANYLQSKVNDMKNDGDSFGQQRYEELFNQFYKGRFVLVMEELKALGDDPQKILKVTGLRDKMLSGQLEKIPWFLREIAGLDWFFQQDAKRTKPQWPQPKDKVLYLAGLVDQIERNHARTNDLQMLSEAIDSVSSRLMQLQNSVTKIFQRTINQALDKLKMVKSVRNL
jgi:hypothetical protein